MVQKKNPDDSGDLAPRDLDMMRKTTAIDDGDGDALRKRNRPTKMRMSVNAVYPSTRDGDSDALREKRSRSMKTRTRTSADAVYLPPDGAALPTTKQMRESGQDRQLFARGSKPKKQGFRVSCRQSVPRQNWPVFPEHAWLESLKKNTRLEVGQSQKSRPQNLASEHRNDVCLQAHRRMDETMKMHVALPPQNELSPRPRG